MWRSFKIVMMTTFFYDNKQAFSSSMQFAICCLVNIIISQGMVEYIFVRFWTDLMMQWTENSHFCRLFSKFNSVKSGPQFKMNIFIILSCFFSLLMGSNMALTCWDSDGYQTVSEYNMNVSFCRNTSKTIIMLFIGGLSSGVS